MIKYSIFRLFYLLCVLTTVCISISPNVLFAQSVCGDSYDDIYNGECDFKNEDTNLWFNQQGWQHQKDDSLDEAAAEGEKYLETYLNSVKLESQDAIDYTVGTMASAMRAAEAGAAAGAFVAALNDPWDLKDLYVDVICEAFWQAFMGRHCATSAELPASLARLAKLIEVAEDIEDVVNNPFLFMGEEWGDLAIDAQRIADEYQSAETMARNLATPDIQQIFQDKFSSYTEMLANPTVSQAQWETDYSLISNTLNDSIRDNLMAVQENKNILMDSDLAELESIKFKNRNAVGRMQATEVGNLLGSQSTQSYIKIRDAYLGMTNMIALDMAAELHEDDVNNRNELSNLAFDPLNPTILNDGQGFQ